MSIFVVSDFDVRLSDTHDILRTAPNMKKENQKRETCKLNENEIINQIRKIQSQGNEIVRYIMKKNRK